MADQEDLKRLLNGVGAWNEWREHYPALITLGEMSLRKPDLSEANLIAADLAGANLSGVSLRGADLSVANLSGAHLRLADLSGANLGDATLRGADLTGANLTGANLKSADLIEACLDNADLTSATLDAARLFKASLARAILNRAHIHDADLSDAKLPGATIEQADLTNADLMGCHLSNASLIGSNLTGVVLAETILADVDLSNTLGLDRCDHASASFVDFKTFERSGSLPLVFLRGVGLPDALIQYLPAILNQPIQYYSCFISYSHRDEEFVQRLHADLQNKGVRCWFAPHDLPIGAKILDTIDEAIRLRDKVLIVLSRQSIGSDWVEDEVKTAFEEERKRKQIVLFPVRLDDSIMETNEAWAAKLRADRHIGDFRQWKDHDQYQRTLDRVLRDLATNRKRV